MVMLGLNLSEDLLHVESVELVRVLEVGLEAVGGEVAEGAAVGVAGSGLVDGEDGLAAGEGGKARGKR